MTGIILILTVTLLITGWLLGFDKVLSTFETICFVLNFFIAWYFAADLGDRFYKWFVSNIKNEKDETV